MKEKRGNAPLKVEKIKKNPADDRAFRSSERALGCAHSPRKRCHHHPDVLYPPQLIRNTLQVTSMFDELLTRPQEPVLELGDYPRLLQHILYVREYNRLLGSPEEHRDEWRKLIKDLTACGPKDETIRALFHTRWHESHGKIRALVDDDHLLVDMLWIWLPRYEGPALILYRGENIDRCERGRIGTAWSVNEQKAEVFASAHNNDGKGGVLLQTIAPAAAIIAGPSPHSERMGEHEFSVDPRKLEPGAITELRRFPPSRCIGSA